MLLVAAGCVVPLLVVALVVAALERSGARATGAGGGNAAATDARTPRAVTDRATSVPPDRVTASRWETLAEEIAQRGDRRPTPRSDRAARRRHLASVLPADARR